MGRREQPYDCAQNSNRPDLQKKQQKKSSIVRPTIEPKKQLSLGNEFQNSKLTQILPSTPT